jgi:hypothetical protein
MGCRKAEVDEDAGRPPPVGLAGGSRFIRRRPFFRRCRPPSSPRDTRARHHEAIRKPIDVSLLWR